MPVTVLVGLIGGVSRSDVKCDTCMLEYHLSINMASAVQADQLKYMWTQ